MNLDRPIKQITVLGETFTQVRLIVAGGVGYVFSDPSTLAATFDASNLKRGYRAGTATIDGDRKAVSWAEHCGCRGTIPIDNELRRVPQKTLLSLARVTVAAGK